MLFSRIGATGPAAVLYGALATADSGAAAYGDDAERLEATALALRGASADFAQDEARGRAMDPDEVVAYALEQIGRLLGGASPTPAEGRARRARCAPRGRDRPGRGVPRAPPGDTRGANYGRASSTRLAGVSAARRKRDNPACSNTSRSRASPAWPPSASPTSCDSEFGVQKKVENP